MGGLYTKTKTQLRVVGNGDVKEKKQGGVHSQESGAMGVQGSEQGSVYMNEEHRISTGSELVIVENNKVHERVIPK